MLWKSCWVKWSERVAVKWLRGYMVGWGGHETQSSGGSFNYSFVCLVVLVTKGMEGCVQMTTQHETEAREEKVQVRNSHLLDGDSGVRTGGCEISRQVCSWWSVLSRRKLKGHLFWHSLLTRGFLLKAAGAFLVCLSCADKTIEGDWHREVRTEKELRRKVRVLKMCHKGQRCRSSGICTYSMCMHKIHAQMLKYRGS